MHPRATDVIGPAVLALLLFALVALIVWATFVNADPASHEALLGGRIIA